MRKTKKFNVKYLLPLVFIVPLAMAYFTFDIYSETTGREVVSNFIRARQVDFQQGNFLGPVTEGQRVIFSSKFITGIKLHDVESGQNLISLGDHFDFSIPSKLSDGEIVTDKVGLLHSHIFYFIKDKNFLLVFEIKSAFLRKFFALFTLVLGLVLGLVIFIVISVQRAAIAQVAKQLRHDISTAMNVVIVVGENSKGLESKYRMSLISLYDRVEDILQGLNLEEMKLEAMDKIPLHLAALMKDVYNEVVVKNSKRESIQWKLNLPHNSIDLCLEGESSGLSRCLHNLIDNAVESIEGEGEISLSLQQNEDKIVLKIEDTGTGISPDDLKKLGTQGFTSKKRGQGLGVYNAKKCVEALGGTLTFESILQRGTTVTLSFPYTPPPPVYQLKKRFFEQKNYINVDDDPLVHKLMNKCKLWRNKDARVKCYFSFPKKLANTTMTPFFLMDYDLRDPSTNGIELIKEHELQNRALLVTGLYNDPTVVRNCVQEKIKILPKILLQP